MARLTVSQVPDVGIRKMLAFCVMLLFIFTADAIMSYWVPGFVQESLGSAVQMGMVMAFSSSVGLVVDFLFPQLMRSVGTKLLVIALLISTLMFQGTMYFATYMPWLIIFLFGMAIWGLYYELMTFANQQFVAQTVRLKQRATAWGLMGVFRSLAYLLGPLIAGLLHPYGDRTILLLASSLSFCGMLMFVLMRMKDSSAEVSNHEINIFSEIGHWWVLLEHVWPLILLSVVMGLVDSVFWTTGTVWSDKLAMTSPWGSFFLTAYMLPGLFTGLLIARMGIVRHKKKIAMTFLILGNLTLTALSVSNAVWWQISVVLVASTLGSFAFPLIDAVYTDIVARMGRERKHLIGLSSSTFSLAYIVGPVVAGFISDAMGEQATFTVVGMVAAILCIAIFFVTPRKLKIPQQQIANW